MSPNGSGTASQRKAGSNGSTRRDELLEIASRLFATRGYSQTTVRDIADEAGILSGSLYHHFDSKEAMLSEILHGFLDSLHTRVVEISKQGSSPREALDELVRLSFSVIHDHQHAVTLYQNEAALLANIAEFDFVARTSEAIEKAWLEVLYAGQWSGEFQQDLQMNFVYRFVRDAIWATVRWYNPRGKVQHEKVAYQYLSVLHGGLLAS